MKAFFDTSILVATFYGDHEHHLPSKTLFLRYDKSDVCTSAHCLAEVYSVLTGMPGKHRATPNETLLFLGNIYDRLTIITLGKQDYLDTIESAAANGITGGAIYDALLAHCALKSAAQSIYTWNSKHFSRLSPSIAARLKTP
jgi:predicted nucleic acid-binding protein